MGVIDAVNKAKVRSKPKGAAEILWDSLEESERREIRDALVSGQTGICRLSESLADAGFPLGRYFLGKVKRGEF